MGVTLIDKKRGKAVRVTPRAEAMQANKQTTFFTEYREKGVPASQGTRAYATSRVGGARHRVACHPVTDSIARAETE